jgi:hypothetical protein
VIASRASIFDFMLFPTEASGSMAYESRVLNTLAIGHLMREMRPNGTPQVEHSIPSYPDWLRRKVIVAVAA